MTKTDTSDGTWTFYDSWAAFPLNHLHDSADNVVGEYMVSLNAPGGGTYGEFAIRFYRFSRGETAARLEVFGDAWEALADSRLLPVLAELPHDQHDPDHIYQLLIEQGYIDKTLELRGTHPSYCPTCHGKGVLDDIAEVVR